MQQQMETEEESISLMSEDHEYGLKNNIETKQETTSTSTSSFRFRYVIYSFLFLSVLMVCMTLNLIENPSDPSDFQPTTALYQHRRPIRHIAITVAVANDSRRLAQLSSMIYPSWRFINTFEEAENTVIDLLISCQSPCLYLPTECRPMAPIQTGDYESNNYTERNGSELFEHDRIPNCWYFPQPPLPETWEHLNYQFMRSIYFLLPYPFNFILPRYDYILRSDEDTFITPYILTYVPPYQMAFGIGHYSIEFTENHMREVATKYGYEYRNVTNICSTWFVPPLFATELVTLSMEIGEKLLINEFNVNATGVGEFFINSPDGDWPKWWRGVVSMYAAEIAINHLIPTLNDSYRTAQMDHPTNDVTNTIKDIVHLHCYQDEADFSKLRWYDGQIHNYTLMNATEKQTYLRKYLMNKEQSAIVGTLEEIEQMSPSTYALFNAWKATSLISIYPKRK